MQREIMTSIPFLSQPSAAAENTEEDLAVAQDLKDTLDAHRNGCVGMAANMIGVPKRIIAFVDEDFGGRIFVMFNPHITAEDGAAGVEVAKRELPDMVLMDVVMPNLNGFQATRTLSRDATTKHIPVILVTTKDQDTDRMWGLRQGAKAYLTKPFSEDELAEVIERIFNTSDAPPPSAA